MSILGNNLLAQYYAQNQYGLWIPEKLGYVTDGLVAMWDGEYNAGNKHDPNATIWKDCVGGVVLTYRGTGTYEWRDKNCRFVCQTGDGQFSKDYGEFVAGPITIENVCAWESVKQVNNGIPPARCYYLGRTAYKQLPVNVIIVAAPQKYSGHTGANIKQLSINTITGYSANDTDPSSQYLGYVNAVKYSYSFAGTSSTVLKAIYIGGWRDAGDIFAGTADVFCFRVYNRQLSVAELRQNRSIDVERFGSTYQP